MSHYWITTAVTLFAGASLAVIGAAQILLARRQTKLIDREVEAAERQAAAAESQIEVAQAQLEVASLQADREKAAYLAPAPSTSHWSESGSEQTVKVYNGGAHPATEVRAWFQSRDGLAKTHAVSWPMIAPGQSQELTLILGRDQVYRDADPLLLTFQWHDGRGLQEHMTALQARQEGTRPR